ncbi:hypothetical protein [Simkania sp.]|uniref:hypothetical protein n=1 Tax=Simkania sp. TaxID=34094 RepID=UPI003B52FFA0
MVLEIFFPSTSCGLASVADTFKESGKAVVTDFQTTKCSTSEKVQKFVTGFQDIGALVQNVSSAVFFTSSISGYFIYQTFPGFISFMFTPLLLLASFASGVIGFEVYQSRGVVQDLQDWIKKEFPNGTDPFYIDDKFCTRWETFKEDLNGQTLLTGFVFKHALDQSSALFEKMSKDLSTFDKWSVVRWFRDPDNKKWTDLLGSLNPFGI